MSYEIVYDKQFIKLKDNLFVPMLYWGSSNCYDFSGRRERNWNVWTYIADNKHYATKEEILANCDKLRSGYLNQDDYSDDNFGYWCSIAIGGSTHATTYGKLKGLFVTGIRKALTIEQLKEMNISVNIHSYAYNNDYEEKGLESYNENPNNGDEFITMLNEANEMYKGSGINVYVTLHGADEYNMKRVRATYFPRKRKAYKERKNVNQYYTILVDGRYFARKLKYGYKYSHYPYVKYATEKEALNRIKKYGAKYSVKLIKEKAFI